MNFNKWYRDFDETDGEANAKDGWDGFRTEMLKILDNPKSWEYIDNETQTLTNKALEKLRNL